ncbi:hypothetical protein AVDCRST_MAG92-5600 [uncultured Coleofasciculus sp.]|uniref:Uncharacterized protein n=1 Tax=uncultured Coleofasciculus sp. TaxID=1267456 RepID=A0A6J4KK20_9CYAN|nr:hypothetical protein AVDCRST_MAG92-5600 [uncultured Coleofasciculus sp.]
MNFSTLKKVAIMRRLTEYRARKTERMFGNSQEADFLRGVVN